MKKIIGIGYSTIGILPGRASEIILLCEAPGTKESCEREIFQEKES